MTDSAGQENRTIDLFGPQLLIETGSNEVGFGGKASYSMQAINDSGFKYNQSLLENGMSSVYADGMYQVEAAAAGASPDNGVGYLLAVHHGDTIIHGDRGFVRIAGKSIVLEAAEELVLQGRKIRIGFSDPGGTDKVDIVANRIHLEPTTKITLKKAILWSSPVKVFDGSMVGKAVIQGIAKAGDAIAGGFGGLL